MQYQHKHGVSPIQENSKLSLVQETHRNIFLQDAHSDDTPDAVRIACATGGPIKWSEDCEAKFIH